MIYSSVTSLAVQGCAFTALLVFIVRDLVSKGAVVMAVINGSAFVSSVAAWGFMVAHRNNTDRVNYFSWWVSVSCLGELWILAGGLLWPQWVSIVVATANGKHSVGPPSSYLLFDGGVKSIRRTTRQVDGETGDGERIIPTRGDWAVQVLNSHGRYLKHRQHCSWVVWSLVYGVGGSIWCLVAGPVVFGRAGWYGYGDGHANKSLGPALTIIGQIFIVVLVSARRHYLRKPDHVYHLRHKHEDRTVWKWHVTAILLFSFAAISFVVLSVLNLDVLHSQTADGWFHSGGGVKLLMALAVQRASLPRVTIARTVSTLNRTIAVGRARRWRANFRFQRMIKISHGRSPSSVEMANHRNSEWDEEFGGTSGENSVYPEEDEKGDTLLPFGTLEGGPGEALRCFCRALCVFLCCPVAFALRHSKRVDTRKEEVLLQQVITVKTANTSTTCLGNSDSVGDRQMAKEDKLQCKSNIESAHDSRVATSAVLGGCVSYGYSTPHRVVGRSSCSETKGSPGLTQCQSSPLGSDTTNIRCEVVGNKNTNNSTERTPDTETQKHLAGLEMNLGKYSKEDTYLDLPKLKDVTPLMSLNHAGIRGMPQPWMYVPLFYVGVWVDWRSLGDLLEARLIGLCIRHRKSTVHLDTDTEKALEWLDGLSRVLPTPTENLNNPPPKKGSPSNQKCRLGQRVQAESLEIEKFNDKSSVTRDDTGVGERTESFKDDGFLYDGWVVNDLRSESVVDWGPLRSYIKGTNADILQAVRWVVQPGTAYTTCGGVLSGVRDKVFPYTSFSQFPCNAAQGSSWWMGIVRRSKTAKVETPFIGQTRSISKDYIRPIPFFTEDTPCIPLAHFLAAVARSLLSRATTSLVNTPVDLSENSWLDPQGTKALQWFINVRLASARPLLCGDRRGAGVTFDTNNVHWETPGWDTRRNWQLCAQLDASPRHGVMSMLQVLAGAWLNLPSAGNCAEVARNWLVKQIPLKQVETFNSVYMSNTEGGRQGQPQKNGVSGEESPAHLPPHQSMRLSLLLLRLEKESGYVGSESRRTSSKILDMIGIGGALSVWKDASTHETAVHAIRSSGGILSGRTDKEPWLWRALSSPVRSRLSISGPRVDTQTPLCWSGAKTVWRSWRVSPDDFLRAVLPVTLAMPIFRELVLDMGPASHDKLAWYSLARWWLRINTWSDVHTVPDLASEPCIPNLDTETGRMWNSMCDAAGKTSLGNRTSARAGRLSGKNTKKGESEFLVGLDYTQFRGTGNRGKRTPVGLSDQEELDSAPVILRQKARGVSRTTPNNSVSVYLAQTAIVVIRVLCMLGKHQDMAQSTLGTILRWDPGTVDIVARIRASRGQMWNHLYVCPTLANTLSLLGVFNWASSCSADNSDVKSSSKDKKKPQSEHEERVGNFKLHRQRKPCGSEVATSISGVDSKEKIHPHADRGVSSGSYSPGRTYSSSLGAISRMLRYDARNTLSVVEVALNALAEGKGNSVSTVSVYLDTYVGEPARQIAVLVRLATALRTVLPFMPLGVIMANGSRSRNKVYPGDQVDFFVQDWCFMLCGEGRRPWDTRVLWANYSLSTVSLLLAASSREKNGSVSLRQAMQHIVENMDSQAALVAAETAWRIQTVNRNRESTASTSSVIASHDYQPLLEAVVPNAWGVRPLDQNVSTKLSPLEQEEMESAGFDLNVFNSL